MNPRRRDSSARDNDRRRDCAVPIDNGHGRVSTLDQLAEIPEEEIWLQKQKSAHAARLSARRAALYAHAGDHRAWGIAPGRPQGGDRLLHAWGRACGGVEDPPAAAALSPLYKHLVRHGHAARNPVGEVERPAINRDEGSTYAFAKAKARKMLDMPAEDTVAGLRDRAILSGRVAPRGDRCSQGRRSPEPRPWLVARHAQGRRCDALAINPQSVARLRAYLETAGHGTDSDGPLFRPLRHNGKQDARVPAYGSGRDRPRG
jgi:hypothetical protein